MNNPLIKSVALLWMFWFLVLYLISGESFQNFPVTLINTACVLGAGALAGAVVIMWESTSLDILRKQLTQGASSRGCLLSVGRMPVKVPMPRKKFGAANFVGVFDFPDYQKRYPQYAALMLAGGEVMAFLPKLPASPIKGGHGGATLIEHSMNVVRTMVEAKVSWRYDGHRNKKGEIVVPLFDQNAKFHAFDDNDPLPILAAFLHDIGKVVCYRLMANGAVKEVKPNHDTEGARLLRRLPELWALPREDVTILLTAIAYYHKVGSLPTSEWLADRGRSLTELLLHTDIETGKKEGELGDGGETPSGVVLPQARPESNRPPPRVEPRVVTKPSPVPPATTAVVEERAGAGNSTNTSEAATGAADHTEEDLEAINAFKQFASLIQETNRINGNKKEMRVGYKFGDWMYISDASLRQAITSTSGKDLCETSPGNAMHPWTHALNRHLNAKGLLRTTIGDMSFTPKSALFDTDDGGGNTMRFVLVVSTQGFDGLSNLKDCKSEPKVVRCSWGDQRAINKDKGTQSDFSSDELSGDTVCDEGIAGVNDPLVSDMPKEIFVENPEIAEDSVMAENSRAVEESAMPEMDNAESPVMTENDSEGLSVDDYAEDIADENCASEETTGFDLKGTLERAARFDPPGPTFKQRKHNDEDCAFFEVDEVIQFYELNADDLGGVSRMNGGKSGKEYFYVVIQKNEGSR